MHWYVRVGIGSLILFLSMIEAVPAKTVTDMTGRTVDVPDTIKSVYGTSPPATWLIYAIDSGQVAGLNFPLPKRAIPYLDPRMANLPVVGGWFGQGRTPNRETLLTAHPDAAVVWHWDKEGVDSKIESLLTELGIPVLFVTMGSVKDYPAALRFMGMLLGKPDRGEVLARYAEAALSDMEHLRNALPYDQRVRIYYAQGESGLATECHTSLHAELIPLCGGINVHQCIARDGYGMETVSLEQVLLYNPDMIVTRDDSFFKNVTSNPLWKNTDAIKNKKIFRIPALPTNWFDRPPSILRLLGMKWLAHNLYPSLYEIDMAAETRQFFALFLDVSLTDDQLRAVLP